MKRLCMMNLCLCTWNGHSRVISGWTQTKILLLKNSPCFALTMRNTIERCTEWQRQLHINNIGPPWAIRLTTFSTFEDLEFADDLALVSQSARRRQKWWCLPVTVNREDLPTTKEFTYSVALSGMRVEQAATSGMASTRPRTPQEC